MIVLRDFNCIKSDMRRENYNAREDFKYDGATTWSSVVGK